MSAEAWAAFLIFTPLWMLIGLVAVGFGALALVEWLLGK